MKNFFLFLSLLILETTAYSQLVTLKGRVFDRKENKGLAKAIVTILDTNIIVVTNGFGEFEVKNLPEGKYNLNVSFDNYGDTLIQNILLKQGVSGNVHVTLPPYCQYDKNINDKKCPSCKKRNMVVPIVYGEVKKPLPERKAYTAGCRISFCEPSWYCRRDKTRF